jgi:NTE family protein
MATKNPPTRPLPTPSSPSTGDTRPPSSPTTRPPRADTAIVLAGAVAQGAFAAGALEIVARRHLPIARVVATSSGALSGTLLAAGVRAGRTEDATEALVDLWTHSAHWCNAVDLSLRDLVRGRGASTSKKLHGIVRRAVEAFVPGAQQPIDLRLVVTALGGDPHARRDECATSFESIVRFADDDFDAPETRERLYTAATAAAAFPGLYAPVTVPGLGQCLDGGATNNAPIKHALEGCDLRRVVVITNTPALVATPPLQGLHLADHLAQVVTDERLYRDLRAARAVNRQLAALDQLVTQGALSPQALATVKDALRWRGRRRIELIEIRPATDLRGGAFTALADRALRTEYIAEGRRAAEEALAHLAAPHADATALQADRTTHDHAGAAPAR